MVAGSAILSFADDKNLCILVVYKFILLAENTRISQLVLMVR